MLMVVYQGRTCRWQILFKLTSKQDYPALHAGLSFQMKRGIHRRTVINSDDLYVAWSKHLMDILMQELCGSNIVTQQYKRSDSDPLGMNGLRCIFILKCDCY